MAGAEHHGHRLRMIKRMQNGFLQEHEILEAMLFNALPRKNTNGLAHRLLAKFETIQNIFSADINSLMEVEGIGLGVASYICLTGQIVRTYCEREELGYIGRFDSRTFMASLMKKYSGFTQEVLDVYLIDAESGISHCKRFLGKDAKRVEIDPTEFSKLFLDKGKAGVVLVHNHPDGRAIPSDADDKMTEQCQLLCSYHNMLLCDHFICAPDGVYSYYLDGKLAEISEKYSVQVLLDERDSL